MIEPIPNLPGGVIGFTFSGPVSRAEYVDVLLPAMQQALEAGGVRLAIVIDDDFGWFKAGAFWEDLKFGLGSASEHLRSWERMAIVSDADWVRHAMAVFGWMVPGEARAFTLGELDEAKAWLAG